jgi:hypothetical protein
MAINNEPLQMGMLTSVRKLEHVYTGAAVKLAIRKTITTLYLQNYKNIILKYMQKLLTF